jgi:hypothetical protein
MKPVSTRRKQASKQSLSASRTPGKKTRKVLGLNASKQIDGEWFYSLGDIETVVAAVLSEIDSDTGAGITLAASETGITLNVVSSDGDEFEVEVPLDSEGEGTPVEEVPEEE